MSRKTIAVADCETDPFKQGRFPEPFIWGLYDGKEYYIFKDTDSFVAFIRTRAYIIYAHNGGKFDWHFLTDYFNPFDDIMVINGRIASIKIGDSVLRDSYNILPVPLAAYQKTKFDYSKLEKHNRKKYYPEILSYLKDDLNDLYTIVDIFIKQYGVNITLASTALKQWCKISKRKTPKTSEYFYSIITDFYYGGRTQCFFNGVINRPFKLVDVNSAYPKAMMNNHPYGESYNIDNELPQVKSEIERAFITLNCVSNGAFPYRTKEGLTFPADNINRTYKITGWEYLAAVDLNLIKNVEIIEVITFSETINFCDYVNHFFSIKDKAKKSKDKANELIAKLFLNSLYGKFAANPSTYKEYVILDPKFITASEIDNYEFAGLWGKWGVVSKPIDEEKQRYYNVAVSASITGNQRAYLLRSLHKVKNPLYCDTDSIVCDSYDKLNISPKLGDWSLDGEFSEGAICGKKLYAFKKLNGEWKIASKGCKLNNKEIYRIAKGEIVTYKSEAPTYSVIKNPYFLERNIQLT